MKWFIIVFSVRPQTENMLLKKKAFKKDSSTQPSSQWFENKCCYILWIKFSFVHLHLHLLSQEPVQSQAWHQDTNDIASKFGVEGEMIKVTQFCRNVIQLIAIITRPYFTIHLFIFMQVYICVNPQKLFSATLSISTCEREWDEERNYYTYCQDNTWYALVIWPRRLPPIILLLLFFYPLVPSSVVTKSSRTTQSWYKQK